MIVQGIFSRPDMTFIKSEEVEYTIDGKKIKGFKVFFEDPNETEGDFFISADKWDDVKATLPTKRATGTLYVRITQSGKFTKVSLKKFVAD